MTDKLPSLLKHRAALDARIEVAYSALKAEAIGAARQLVKKHGLRVGDLFVAGRLRKINARYRDPNTGRTWTGRGRPPRWIVGKDRKLFEM
jgi:DNA-binding protein H-NS